jgi:hypothetical protein
MKTNFRNVYKPILEIAALLVVAIDLALGVGLTWISSRVASGRDASMTLRSQVAAQQMLVKQLQQTIATLPVTAGQVKLFLDNHVPSRREGFSRATHLIWSLKEKSGVQVEGVSYRPAKRVLEDPLEPLSMEVTLDGTFADLIRFAHSLETASDFVVIRGLNFTGGESGKLSLHLSADFYISP